MPRIRKARPDDLAAVPRLVEEAYSPCVARIGCRPGPMVVASGAVQG